MFALVRGMRASVIVVVASLCWTQAASAQELGARASGLGDLADFIQLVTRGPEEDDTENLAPYVASQLPVTSHWWADVTASGTGSASGDGDGVARVGAQVGATFHAEEEGGIANSFLFSRAVADVRAQIGAGGRAPGGSLSARAWSRVLQLRFTDEEGKVYELLPIDLWAAVDLRVAPSLASRREMLRRPYDREYAGGTLSFGQVFGSKWSLLPFDVAVGRVGQETDIGLVRRPEILVGFGFVSYDEPRGEHQPDLHLGIVRATVQRALAAEAGGEGVVRVRFVQVSGLDLYYGRVYADGFVGVAGSVLGRHDPGTGYDPLSAEDVPNTGAWIGHARLYWFIERTLVAGVEAEQDVYLTPMDLNLAVETRAGGFAEWRNRYGVLTLRAFGSRNVFWTDQDNSETTFTGGGSGSWRHDLGGDLSLVTSVEVARSYYSDLGDAGPLQPTPTMGGQVFVTLAKHFGRGVGDRPLVGPGTQVHTGWPAPSLQLQ